MAPYIKDKYFHDKSTELSISDSLDGIEAMLARLDGKANPIAEKIFLVMDDIQNRIRLNQMDETEAKKINSQIEYVSSRIRKSAKLLIGAIGGRHKLQEKRKSLSVNDDHWWWFLDDYLDEKRKNRIKRLSLIGVITVVVIGIAAFVYDRFLAPPPEVRQRLSYEASIDNLIEQKDYERAMQVMDEALTLAPDYYPLWIKKGVLAKVLNDPQTEQESYQKAETLTDSMENFYIERSSVYMLFDLFDDILADANSLIEMNPDSAEGYLYIGMVQENRGELSDASQSYEKAAALAEEQDKMQLAATIKVRMAMMMQSIPIPTQ